MKISLRSRIRPALLLALHTSCGNDARTTRSARPSSTAQPSAPNSRMVWDQREETKPGAPFADADLEKILVTNIGLELRDALNQQSVMATSCTSNLGEIDLLCSQENAQVIDHFMVAMTHILGVWSKVRQSSAAGKAGDRIEISIHVSGASDGNVVLRDRQHRERNLGLRAVYETGVQRYGCPSFGNGAPAAADAGQPSQCPFNPGKLNLMLACARGFLFLDKIGGVVKLMGRPEFSSDRFSVRMSCEAYRQKGPDFRGAGAVIELRTPDSPGMRDGIHSVLPGSYGQYPVAN